MVRTPLVRCLYTQTLLYGQRKAGTQQSEVLLFKWALERLRDLYDELGIRHPTVIVSDRDRTVREPAVDVQGRGKVLDNDLNVAVQSIRRRRNEGTMVPGGNLEYSGYTPGGKIIRF